MANATQSVLGSVNKLVSDTGAGGAYDSKYGTYLKLFSGELFKAYESATIARDTVQRRSLKNGKSLQFIFTGRMQAAYHTPGTPILGSGDPPVAEKTITCDDLLISSAFIYDLDETLAHYSLRGEISKKIGHALAESYDKKIFRAIAKSARMASPITSSPGPEPGGSQIQLGVTKEYDAQALVDAFFEAASILDEKNMPKQGRTAVLNPRQYYALVSQVSTNILNRDYGNGQGNLNSGEGLYEIAGIQIRRSNNLPFLAGTVNDEAGQNTSAGTEQPTDGTGGDFSKHCGLIYYKDAAGVVEAIGPQVQVTSGDVSVLYQGDVIVGRLAMGVGTLNPAAAIELISDRS